MITIYDGLWFSFVYGLMAGIVCCLFAGYVMVLCSGVLARVVVLVDRLVERVYCDRLVESLEGILGKIT